MSAEVISKNKSYIMGTRLPFVSTSVLPAQAGTIKFQMITAVLTIISFIIDKFI